MTSRWSRLALRVLLKKPCPDRFPTSGPEANKNDYYSVRVENLRPDDDRTYLVRSLSPSGDLVTTYWDGHQVHEVTLPFADVPLDRISVTHFFRAWRVRYSSLRAAAICALLKVNRWRMVVQKHYDRNLRYYDDRHELLDTLVDLRRPWTSETPSVLNLLSHIYGQRIQLSERMPECWDRLQFLLQSLAFSGDIELKGDGPNATAIVKPKAMHTLSEFQISSARHRDTTRLTRYQVFVAFAMLVLAAVTLLVRFLGD